jgi:hypothetical protein
MKIIYIKLTSGEEIVAQEESRSPTSIELKKARTVHIVNHQGQPVAQFIPSMMFHDDTKSIFVDWNNIAITSNGLEREYEKRYLEATSGIQLASSLNG